MKEQPNNISEKRDYIYEKLDGLIYQVICPEFEVVSVRRLVEQWEEFPDDESFFEKKIIKKPGFILEELENEYIVFDTKKAYINHLPQIKFLNRKLPTDYLSDGVDYELSSFPKYLDKIISTLDDFAKKDKRDRMLKYMEEVRENGVPTGFPGEYSMQTFFRNLKEINGGPLELGESDEEYERRMRRWENR